MAILSSLSRSAFSWLAIASYASLVAASVHSNSPRWHNQKWQDAKRSMAARAAENTTVGTYDYIVVGGGLTGLIVANRLSEDPSVSVLVVEYGSIDRRNITKVPYYANSENWSDLFNITSAPEPYLGDMTFSVLAGAVVGGGSVVNGMELDRASAADYDSWEEMGNPGWGWEGLLPYFEKSQTFDAPPAYIEEQYNYTWDASVFGDGPLQASFPHFQYPDIDKFFAGLEELGVPFIQEHAAGNAVGTFWTHTSLDPKNEERSDTLTAYYDPASNRTNLHLLMNSQVTELIFSSNLTAQGVKIKGVGNNSTTSAYATKEVILAAGAVHTPQILQLSGIGPKEVLDAAGIDVKLDVPAVGNNFQDHPTGYVFYSLATPSFPNPKTISTNDTFNQDAIVEYDISRTGPYTLAHGNSAGFLPLSTITDEAETLLGALAAQNATAYLPDAYTAHPELLAGFEAQRAILHKQIGEGSVAVLEFPFNGGGVVPNAIQKPLSRGTVYLNASNPTGEPVVTHHVFQNPFDQDQMYASINYSRQVFKTEAVQSLTPIEILPGANVTEPAAIFSVLAANGLLGPTFAHPSCSCPMQPQSAGGCVGPDLLFYGTSKLSIVDASIIPIIPAAHLQSSMYAIGEKAADLIKARA